MKGLMTVIAGFIVLAGIFLAGAYSEYSNGFPFAMILTPPLVEPARLPPPSRNTPVSSVPSNVIPKSSTSSTNVPIVSRAQGAQDAARADVPMGETADLQRCYETMIARKLVPAEAKTVCGKLIGGISH
jgi:hypothetical protein